MSAQGPISIHVLSDSLGETGEMVARAAVAQFELGEFHIERLPKVTSREELRETVNLHCGADCIFLYTLVDPDLRVEMESLIRGGVQGVDILGPSVAVMQEVSGAAPTGTAGAVHRTDAEYFDRIEATEFAVMHDDGRNPQGLTDADVVLLGVSRTSKTPLAMYLAFKGYRVANIPLAAGLEPPKELFQVDPRRIFGLVTDANVLIAIRRERMREMGTFVPKYAEREAVEHELEDARALMRRLGCIVIRTDNRAVEESAQEILKYLDGATTVHD